MSKRKRGRHKRLFPKKFASDFIDVTKPLNQEILSQYHQGVRSSVGPKSNRLPLLSHTFNQQIINGEVHDIRCRCGKDGSFPTMSHYEMHVAKARRRDGPKFKPDNHEAYYHKQLKIGHVDPERAFVHVLHNAIPTPRRVVRARERILKQIHAEEWHYFEVFRDGDDTVYLGAYRDTWKFKYVSPVGELYSSNYSSKELAISYFHLNKITWL